MTAEITRIHASYGDLIRHGNTALDRELQGPPTATHGYVRAVAVHDANVAHSAMRHGISAMAVIRDIDVTNLGPLRKLSIQQIPYAANYFQERIARSNIETGSVLIAPINNFRLKCAMSRTYRERLTLLFHYMSLNNRLYFDTGLRYPSNWVNWKELEPCVFFFRESPNMKQLDKAIERESINRDYVGIARNEMGFQDHLFGNEIGLKNFLSGAVLS